MPRSVLTKLVDIYPSVAIEYGVAEAAIIRTMEKQARRDALQSIGQALPNTQLYVLNRFRQLLPNGSTGESYLGARGLARGYLHDAERTATCFFPTLSASGRRMSNMGESVVKSHAWTPWIAHQISGGHHHGCLAGAFSLPDVAAAAFAAHEAAAVDWMPVTRRKRRMRRTPAIQFLPCVRERVWSGR